MKTKQIKCPFCGIKMNHKEQEVGMCYDCEQDGEDVIYEEPIDDLYDDEY